MVAEGVEAVVPLRDEVEVIVHSLVGGLRSGMSYSNARTIGEMHEQRPVRADHARRPARELPARRRRLSAAGA